MPWLLCEEAERNRKCFWWKHWFEGNNFNLTVFRNGGKGETEVHTHSCAYSVASHTYFSVFAQQQELTFEDADLCVSWLKEVLGHAKKMCWAVQMFWSLKPEPLTWDAPTPFSDPQLGMPPHPSLTLSTLSLENCVAQLITGTIWSCLQMPGLFLLLQSELFPGLCSHHIQCIQSS